jgi:two-component system, LytTR family, sensor kinase
MKFHFNKKRFVLYLWLGASYFLLWSLSELAHNAETFFRKSWNHVWLLSYLIMLNYILFEFTLPFIRFSWKRILLWPFMLFAHLMLYSFGFYGWRQLGITLHLYFELIQHASVMKGVTYHVPYAFGSVAFFAVLTHIYDYVKLRKTAQQLRIEKQEAELNYLKAQTNPHFLFNTLNNIYALAREKSDLAPESILRLSKILRFMLYESGGAFIAVEQELKIIGDYIALERLRYDDSLRVNFNYDIEDMKQAIPPLLLIPLVENAFKHGASETGSHPFVDVHLSLKNRQLNFLVKNSTDSSAGDGVVRESIGLSNLRRQLQLLYTDYDLSVKQHQSEFTAALKINLASHV